MGASESETGREVEKSAREREREEREERERKQKGWPDHVWASICIAAPVSWKCWLFLASPGPQSEWAGSPQDGAFSSALLLFCSLPTEVEASSPCPRLTHGLSTASFSLSPSHPLSCSDLPLPCKEADLDFAVGAGRADIIARKPGVTELKAGTLSAPSLEV